MEASSQSSEREEVNLSPTVKRASDQLKHREPVTAATFAKAILELHPTYAHQKASKVRLDEGRAEQKRSVQLWLTDIRTLFDRSTAPELHGRLVLLGLSYLEPDLQLQLQQEDFLTDLASELQEALDTLLTDRGRALREPSDSVPIQPDDPLCQVTEDQLGRAAFASYLAVRISTLAKQQAYSLHLSGPWGAGKSTVLNFLREELEKSGQWLVFEFNAWQHQHIRPPWWSLMDSVFQQSKPALGLRKRFAEHWWRFSSGRLPYFIAAVFLMWLLVLAFSVFPANSSSMTASMQAWAVIADSTGKILAVFVTIWALVTAASRSLLVGSARAAQSYTELASDPMNRITRRFDKLIGRLAPKRVAIFIDDLDRCQDSYVIELLEGIQTLFRSAPVVFVVSADRRWLNACFEEVYSNLTPWVHEPGKSLGTLFLEKVFQFSTSVPAMPQELKKDFWRGLIHVATEPTSTQVNKVRASVREVMAGMESEGEMMQEIDKSHKRSATEQRAIREEAVVRLAAPEIVQRTENTLKPFVALLEPNPRAMKRLVNTYSANRALAILSEVDIERDRLARWTILSMRWPDLAEYLEKHPEHVEMIGRQDVSDIPQEVRELFKSVDVAKVVRDESAGVSLDPEIVQKCALIHA